MHAAPTPADIEKELTTLRPQAEKDLQTLVRIDSVYHQDNLDNVKQAATTCADLLGAAGMEVRIINPPPGSPNGQQPDVPAPIVYATRSCGDPHAPTVLLYAHYDVVGADWAGAFDPRPVDGRMTGRGAADDKSGIILHLVTCRYLQNHPDLRVNLKLVLEGEEEQGTETLPGYMTANPDLFRADVVSLADAGNVALGKPTLTTSLRGFVMADVTVSTLDGEVHNGMYGGPAPDAFMALTHMLAKLHDEEGNVAVPGLKESVWTGHQPDTAEFREAAKVRAGVPLAGTGSLGSRLYSKPSINVVGLEEVTQGSPPPDPRPLPPVRKSRNILQPAVRARLGVRLPPDEDPKAAYGHLEAYLLRPDVNTWRADVKVSYVSGAPGFVASADAGPGFEAARTALRTAYAGKEVELAGQGASIPLTNTLQAIEPKAAILLWGCEEPTCNIHGDHESVSLDELHSMTFAQVLLLVALARSKDGAWGAGEQALTGAATS
ncbi:M20/M25/M40 family metallo-hydrolase [Streptomyces sp. NPDC057702]|uniref:M20/M25/M40 family metallo-hydrolase n=1 Tax=unclassified Streptomyces TaxID=2593676 RepID=UPI0036C29B74